MGNVLFTPGSGCTAQINPPLSALKRSPTLKTTTKRVTDEHEWNKSGDLSGPGTHFDMKLHFGDEQFEVDATQLPVAFAQMALGTTAGREGEKHVCVTYKAFRTGSITLYVRKT